MATLPSMQLNVMCTPDVWISLATLTALEIVLGIDNIVFISILADRLPRKQQSLARRLGLGLALLTRLGLLCSISWVMSLNEPLFSVLGQGLTGRSLILVFGGLFLIGKSTHEMVHSLEIKPKTSSTKLITADFITILIQIMLLDIVFSLDSVITAVGMVTHLSTMVVAMIIAVFVMLIFANSVGDFVMRHPSIKVLALSFLILIGVMLLGEAFGHHIPKGYIYFAMAFSLAVELVNMRMRKQRLQPVTLHGHHP